jgi:hypothetical protein
VGAGLNRPEERILTAVTAAARTRRARETSRVLWRVAPVVSAIAVAVSALVRWRHAQPFIPLIVLAAFGTAWAVYAFVQRRFVRVSDTTAAAIDDDAGLGGELRSAAWFATAQKGDEPWAAFHVERAAAHLESIDLARLYPPVSARRARVATAVMVAVVLLFAAVFPDRSRSTVSARTPRADIVLAQRVSAVTLEGVPAELPQELQDLLAAIESGTLPPPGVADPAMQNMLSQLQALKDPKALAALARAMAADRKNGSSAAAMKELAERAKRDAAMMPPSEIRDALDELSKKLSDPERGLDSAGLEESDEAEPQGGVDLAGAPPQSSQDASAIAGLGMVSLSKQDTSDPNAPPGMGAGGTSSAPSGGGTMPDISRALRHEIIEANEDDVSSDVQTDARRKTERGQATASFTSSNAAAFDGARASAPPQVPEARRAGIQTYFSRKQ